MNVEWEDKTIHISHSAFILSYLLHVNVQNYKWKIELSEETDVSVSDSAV